MHPRRSLFLATLAVLASSAAHAAPAAANPATSLPASSHPGAARVSVTITNHGTTFRDLQIGSRSYTVEPFQSIHVAAPAGTGIYASSAANHVHRGDLLFQLSPADEAKALTLR
jgi:hypothetical protein